MVNDKRAFRSIWRWWALLRKHIGAMRKKLIDRHGTGMMGLFGFPAPSNPLERKKIKKGTEGGEEEIARIGTSVIYSLPPCFHITWFLPHPTTTINRPSIISTLTGDIQFPVRRFIYFEHVKKGSSSPTGGTRLKRSTALASTCKWGSW